MISKGAHVTVSSPTSNNVCETGTCSYTALRFTDYCQIVVSNTGWLTAFVDHSQYLANRYIAFGATLVDSYYPIYHMHSSLAGANLVLSTFLKGLLCGRSPLAMYVKNTTASITGSCI
ncbi:hypothetical protein BJ878DRAFT_422918 [Calycina marina]|uniref:Uncharacterized protein n=1 Tax=Calycina marina TaxID=1763456 RepID=A0A9P8CE66_9HELO|nr:hypothetical protein BJ878DRAFT_422918 [Calycina marina]